MCYLYAKKQCHSVDLCSHHQFLKHQWCKPLHTGARGGCRKFHWSCILTCVLHHSQLQQCNVWHCHWPPTSQEQDLAHTCAWLSHWWEDMALKGDKNEQVSDFFHRNPSSVSIFNGDKSAHLTCLHCDLCARQTEACPRDGKDHHCI